MQELVAPVFAVLFVGTVIYAIVSDFIAFRIPESVWIVLTAAFAVYAVLDGVDPILPRLYLAGGAFIMFFAFFALGWMGAGDVKFISALMLWPAPSQTAFLIVLVALIGGLFALLLIGLRFASAYFPRLGETPVLGKMSRWAAKGVLPYGIPIGLAALAIAPAIFSARY